MSVGRLALLLATLLLPAEIHAQDFDLLVRNGRIVDGSGNPWFHGDVGVRDDRIVAVGDLSGSSAGRVLDATGMIVAPGFIDAHSHAGPGLASEGLSHAEPLLRQGITTVFVNPDGGGPVDMVRQRERLLHDGLGVNVAQLVPHGAVRSAVLGMQDRLADADELDRMRELVRAGMEAGAWGLSSGPFYAPGSYSDTGELVELARVAAAFGGAYTSHVRDESDYTIGVVASLEEVITVAREAGLPGVHTHVKVLGPPVWGFAQALVRRVEVARAEGVEVYADQYPYPASATSLGAALLPRWAQAGGGDSLRARMAREPDAGRIREAIEANLRRRGGADRIQFRRVRWDETLEGRLLSDVARDWGQTPEETVWALTLRGGAAIVSFNMLEDDVRTLMVQPWTMTASDGGLVPWMEGVPHPRSYGTFPRKIRHYVMEEGVVSLEAAIRSMTSLPAQVFRMADRGRIEVGRVADLVIFDLDEIRDRATFTEPHQLSEGVVHVVVNGRPALADGALAEERYGEVLRKR